MHAKDVAERKRKVQIAAISLMSTQRFSQCPLDRFHSWSSVQWQMPDQITLLELFSLAI